MGIFPDVQTILACQTSPFPRFRFSPPSYQVEAVDDAISVPHTVGLFAEVIISWTQGTRVKPVIK